MINFKQLLFMSVFFISGVIQAQDISEKTAQRVANNFLKFKTHDPLKKTSKQLDLVNITSAIDEKYDGFYVFNAENGKGFCIVSSESANHPILAYSTNSSLTNIKKNSPEFLNILNSYQHKSQELRSKRSKKSNSKESELIKKEWDALISDNGFYSPQNLTKRIPTRASLPDTISPLIQTKWNQGRMYNRYTPITYEGDPTFTGSAATAMAQIMKFWRYPTTGNDSLTYRIPSVYFHYFYNWRWKKLSVNFQNTTYDWDNMPITLSNSSSQDQINAVATLMFHAGVSVNTMYSPIGSGAHSEKVPNALKNYFKYSSDIELKDRTNFQSNEEWLYVIKNQIFNRYPVYLSSIRNDAEHAYIADGYQNDFIHLNLGWGGEANGYYNINDLRGYSSSQLIVINIHPSDSNCTLPDNLYTSNVSSNSATLAWNKEIKPNGLKIQYKATGDNDWTLAAENITGTSFILTNLLSNTTYTARVTAYCDSIQSNSNNFSDVSFQTNMASPHTLAPCINNYEPNNSFEDAHLIDIDSTYYAGIGSSNDVDYYKFVLTRNSNLFITLDELSNDYDIKLYNRYHEEIGQSIAGDKTREKIKVENVLPGTYYLKIYGYNGAFNESNCYKLNIDATPATPLCSSNYEPNDSFNDAYPIDILTTYYASIGTSRDSDFYKFTLDTDAEVNILLQNIYYGYDFNLYDSSQNLIARGIFDSPNNKIIHDSNLASGTYYIEITGRFNPFECYSLLIDTNISKKSCINNYEPNESFENAIEIKTNTPYSAGIRVPNDLDYYKFTLGKKSNVTVTLQRIPEEYELKLFNSSHTEIGRSYNEDGSDGVINLNDLEADTYYILVQGINGAYNGARCYGLLVESIPSTPPCIYNFESNDSIQVATPINLNTSYQAGIGSSTDKDYYKFIINEVSDVTIFLQNLPKNYDLELYDDFGDMVESSTNKGNTDEKIEVRNLPIGKYYVYIFGYDGAFDTTQCYDFKVNAAPARSLCSNNYEPNDTFESAYSIRNILTYSSDISSPTDYDYYKIYIGENADLKVILENLPNDYDLKLYNNLRREIGSSTNSGTMKEVIDIRNLSPGIYYVYVYGKNGAFDPSNCYNLSVNFVPSTNSAKTSKSNEDSFILYPNPVHDVINIKGPNILKNGSLTTLTILDRNARVVKTMQTEVKENMIINVSDLPPNHYVLQIEGQNYRFIKN